MPRFLIYQKDFIKILKEYNFRYTHTKGSHNFWEGSINGKYYVVQVDVKYDFYSDTLLMIMIVQSGIPKEVFKVFRKTGRIIKL